MKLLLIGYGKMGKLIASTAEAAGDEIVGVFHRENLEELENTGKIADAYAEKYPNIVRVIHQENGGHGEGINQGIRHANGKYFKVVDSDDWVNENALKAVLHKLNRLEAVGGVDLMVVPVLGQAEPEVVPQRTHGAGIHIGPVEPRRGQPGKDL